jgi:hypothetical protein
MKNKCPERRCNQFSEESKIDLDTTPPPLVMSSLELSEERG